MEKDKVFAFCNWETIELCRQRLSIQTAFFYLIGGAEIQRSRVQLKHTFGASSEKQKARAFYKRESRV